MVPAGPMDGISTLVSNSSVAAGGIGRSFARSHSLPAFFVLGWVLFASTTCDGVPMSTLIDPETNQPFAARFAISNTGSVKNDFIVAYLQRCVLDLVPDVSLENPVVGIYDGFWDHISVAVLDFCQKHGISLILLPPHTSQALQPEDLVNFLVFKPAFRKAKQIRVMERTLAGMLPDLSWPDLMQVTCKPWERAFSKERNAVAWRHRGLNSFMWCVEHRLRQEEEAAKLHSATAVLNPPPVICGASHKGAGAGAADPADNVAAPVIEGPLWHQGRRHGVAGHHRRESETGVRLKEEGGGASGAGTYESAEAGLACSRDRSGHHHRGERYSRNKY